MAASPVRSRHRSAAQCQKMAAVLTLTHAFGFTPFVQERAPASWQRFFQFDACVDAIDTKMPKSISQFAPGNQHASVVEESDRYRPKHPLLGRAFIRCSVANPNFAFTANRMA